MWVTIQDRNNRRCSLDGENLVEDPSRAFREALPSANGTEDEIGRGETDNVSGETTIRQLIRSGQNFRDDGPHPN
jgi:hypothetical protein